MWVTVVFGVLGPLEVTVAGRPVALGGPKPRALLATLLLHANSAVSVDLLAEVLWPSGTPRSAAANVRTYVHALRGRLAGSGAGIERRGAGYALVVDPDSIDLCRFEAEVAAATGPGALVLLERACGRWRGRPLGDLPHSQLWDPTLARLTELRLTAEERRLRLRTEAGAPDGAVADLRGLLVEHPLREELWRLLVGALVAAGRIGEARATCARAGRLLRAELGVDPRLDELLAEAAPEVEPVCQLPLDLPDFTGRSDVLAPLAERARAAVARGTPAVVVISGPPGVGKSALAVRVAHAVRAEFPDGQLHVDLAGTSARPRTPMEVLPELLRALGVSAVPRGPSERAALLRSRLARGRTCVVLDDAASAAQVQPLLPGVGGCLVLVTSRTLLPDLAGAEPVELDVLGREEATALLTGIVGARRVEAEPVAAGAILRFCGYLPLAIRIAGTRLRHRRGTTLRAMADRLRDERHRLDELRVGDLAVRASLSLGYDLLTGDAARALRWSGMLGPGQWPGWVVAALLGRPDAEDVLGTLVDAHLVEQTATGRHRLHDLVRCFAAEQAERDPRPVRRDAVRRVLDGYLALAVTAADAMPIRFFGVYPEATAVAPAPVRDPIGWFEAELGAAVAAVGLAVEWDLPDLAWRLASALAPYLDLCGRHDEWQRTHAVALAAARRAGARRGEAIVLRNLGQLAVYRDEYADALAAFRASARLFEEVGDQRGAGLAHAGLGTVLRIGGRLDEAFDHCHAALARFTEVGDPHGEAAVRLATGSVWFEYGCLAPAARWFGDAHALAAATGDRHREAQALRRLATLDRRRGDLETAGRRTDRAVAILAELRDEHCLGYARQDLGELCLSAGDLGRARPLLEGALRRHRRGGDRRSEAEVRRLLAGLHATLGERGAAGEHARRAGEIEAELAVSSRCCS